MPKHIPLRQWASSSYDKNSGRAASGLLSDGSNTTCDGERVRGDQQIPNDPGVHGSPGWAEWQRQHDGYGPKK
jgi:hypothetical protein